jgi:hypothetical protein
MKTTISNNHCHDLSGHVLMLTFFRSVNWTDEEEPRTISTDLTTGTSVDVEYALDFVLTFILENDLRDGVIFKIGDDMQQDQLTIQLLEVMDHIVQGASPRPSITADSTLAVSSVIGCCQFINHSRVIGDISMGEQRIHDFLEEDEQTPINVMIETFTASLAADCVMTCVLKIGDPHTVISWSLRIDGSSMSTPDSSVGGVTKPVTPSLKLNSEMVAPIGPDGFQRLCG